jgi:hypothetical protein
MTRASLGETRPRSPNDARHEKFEAVSITSLLGRSLSEEASRGFSGDSEGAPLEDLHAPPRPQQPSMSNKRDVDTMLAGGSALPCGGIDKPSSSSTATPPGSSKKRGIEWQRKKEAAKARKHKKRVKDAAASNPTNTSPKPSVLKRFKKSKGEAFEFNASEMATAGAGSFIGGALPGETTSYTMEDLQAEGFRVIRWDGRYVDPAIFTYY